MGRARFSPRAQRQLQDIWLYIAQDDETAADRLITRVFDKIDLAADNPGIGVARPDIEQDARMLIEGAYLVLYRPEALGILVVAIVHGMREPTNWLD